MKMYQHKIHIIAAALLLCACGEIEETVTFETVTAEKIAALSSDSIPPTCSVTIRLEQATAKSGRPGEIINSTVASRLFNRGDDGLKDAAQAFADEYTANYYIISGHTQKHVAGSTRIWYERLKVITLPRELVINET